MRKVSGFSLIELLVVVAIIGLLAAIGLVAYTQYIDGVKQEATLNARVQAEKAVSEHLLVLEAGLTGPSEAWFETVQADQNLFCKSYVAALVNELNDRFKNQINERLRPFVNGHDPAPVGPVTIGGGQTLVFCADKEAMATQTRIVTCTNSGKESVTTTGTWAQIFSGAGGLERSISEPIPDGECPHPESDPPSP